MEIPSLILEMNPFDGAVIWWRNASFVLLLIGAIVTALYVGATLIGYRMSDQAKKAQVALDSTKDERLRGNLREKDLKIAELGATAATAKEEAARADENAAQANERAQSFERDKIALRRDLTVATGKVAALQRDAADARTEQQRVAIELAKQQKETADAKRQYLELQEQVKPRALAPRQLARLVDALKAAPRGSIQVEYPAEDKEAKAYAIQIANAILAAGWTINQFIANQDPSRVVYGLHIRIRDPKAIPTHAETLRRSFASVGIPLADEHDSSLTQDLPKLVIGSKPPPEPK